MTKTKKTSPTQRTLVWLRASGHVVAITERWNPFAKLRQDLFGFIDLVAMHEGTVGLLGVQTTSGDNHAARKTKILGLAAARLWLSTGNRIWIVSWRKVGAKGTVKKWEPRLESIEIGDFE